LPVFAKKREKTAPNHYLLLLYMFYGVIALNNPFHAKRFA